MRLRSDGELHHSLGRPLAEIHLAAQNLTNRANDAAADLLLVDIPDRASAERPLSKHQLVVHAQHEQLHIRKRSVEVLDHLNPAAILESNINDRDVRMFGVSNLLRLGNSAGLATDGEIVLRRNQTDEPLTHERMVIDDQNFGSHAEKYYGIATDSF